MIVHKCDACGKIFNTSQSRRKYEIRLEESAGFIGDSHRKILVDICDDCYNAIEDFLDRSEDDKNRRLTHDEF